MLTIVNNCDKNINRYVNYTKVTRMTLESELIMKNVELNDSIVDIFQDICETESMIKILRESLCSENRAVTMSDIGNTLEIVVAKISNIRYSLDKYIDIAFSRK